MDATDARLYLARRRHESAAIRDRADAITRELDAALSDPGATVPMNALHFAEWAEGRRRQLEHIEVELFVLAFAPAPPVWLLYREPVPLPWWRGLWRW